MSINIEDLNYENTENKRFYLRENGQIIYKYDFYGDKLKDLQNNQELLMEDKSEDFALPEFWYYRSNCPAYIYVTDISSYNTIETDINKTLFLSASSQTSNNNIVLVFELRHNAYTHISYATDLSSEAALANVTVAVPEGTEDNVNFENATVVLDNMENKTVNIVSGRASLVLNGEQITSPQLSGSISIGSVGTFYFSINNIELIQSVLDSQKITDIRKERDNRLQVCDWLVIRHITQQGIDNTTLSLEQYEDLCTYMQALRDVPENIEDIDNVEWPEIPQSLANIL